MDLGWFKWGNADARLSADILHWHTGIALLEKRDDLRLGELRLFHDTSWRGYDVRKFYFSDVYLAGELTPWPNRQRANTWQVNTSFFAGENASVSPTTVCSQLDLPQPHTIAECCSTFPGCVDTVASGLAPRGIHAIHA